MNATRHFYTAFFNGSTMTIRWNTPPATRRETGKWVNSSKNWDYFDLTHEGIRVKVNKTTKETIQV